MSQQIHWHEGLFVQPHHFQWMQRSLSLESGQIRRFARPYGYGLIYSEMSLDELNAGQLRFTKLHAILPDGTEFLFPENATLPSLDVAAALRQVKQRGFKVLLAVPKWRERGANSFDTVQEGSAKAKIRYQLQENRIPDENRGDNEKPIVFRKLNGRLLVEGEDTSDLEQMVVLRVVHGVGESVGTPQRDKEHVPPCLVVGASPVLREIATSLSAAVKQSRDELANRLRQGGFNHENIRGLQFEQVLRLRTLNRFAGILPALSTAPNIAPFEFYLELRELLGELTALYPAKDDFAVEDYWHDDPFVSFRQLDNRIRQYLKGKDVDSWKEIPFTPDTAGRHTAVITEDQFRTAISWYLQVRTNTPPEQLVPFVTNGDLFKLLSAQFATGHAIAIRGLPLEHQRVAPLAMPGNVDQHYFRLSVSGDGEIPWKMIKTEKRAGLWWNRPKAGEQESAKALSLADATFTLFYTLNPVNPDLAARA